MESAPRWLGICAILPGLLIELPQRNRSYHRPCRQDIPHVVAYVVFPGVAGLETCLQAVVFRELDCVIMPESVIVRRGAQEVAAVHPVMVAFAAVTEGGAQAGG